MDSHMTDRAGPILIAAGNPGVMTGAGNNTWLVDGAEPTLIDAGVGAASHLADLGRHLGSRVLARVVVTHGHPDHASGVPALRQRWPAVDVCKLAPPDEPGWVSLSDGQALRAGDGHLEVVHTPGHAADHVCLWDSVHRVLYGGDMLVAGSSVMIPGSRGGGLRAYLTSLERLAALGPLRVYPGHGPVIDRPLEIIGDYVRHRALRERQVLQCLDDGVTDVDAIVSRLHPGLPDGLRHAARLTVEAHLDKLREDGRFR